MGRPFLRPPLRPLLRPVQHPLLLALSRALLLAALWGAASAGALTPAAQAPGAAASANGAATASQAAPPPDITELQAQLAKLAATADTDEDARALVAQVEAISAGANRLISARTSQLNDLNARLTELGDAPAAGTTEDPDITRQRASLTKQRNAIDADIRLARLVTVDARQRGTEVLSKRQKVATDRLLERSDSPLSGAFWAALAEAWPADLARLQPLNDELRQGWARAATPGNRGAVLFTLLATLAGVLLANVVIERSLVRLCQHPDAPPASLVQPELMGCPAGMDEAWASVHVLGPGLGQDEWARARFEHRLAAPEPLVLDADGLNWLAQAPRHQDNWVLTPHPGEAARLLGCTIAEVEGDRFAAVSRLQQRYGGVVLLKGAGSLICDGRRISLCDEGNPGMASGGMGDLLSGIIAALLAQGWSAGMATRLGAVIHAEAADLAAAEGERGMLASDLLPWIRRLVNPTQ